MFNETRSLDFYVHSEACRDVPGPSIMPVTSSILSSLVTTRIPSDGLFWSSANSRISRRITAGVTDYGGRMNINKNSMLHCKLNSIPFCVVDLGVLGNRREMRLRKNVFVQVEVELGVDQRLPAAGAEVISH